MDGELDLNAAKEDATSSSPQPASQPTEEAPPMATEENDDDDDVVLVEEESQDRPPADPPAEAPPSPPVSSSAPPASAEPIVIDDEEDSPHKAPPSTKTPSAGASPAALTEPDSELRISSVTTLGSKEGAPESSPGPGETAAEDMALKITSVTSLQEGAAVQAVEELEHSEENGLQISSAYSLTSDGSAGLDPQGAVVHNGDSGTHDRTDGWQSQAGSAQRSHRQTGDEPSTKPSGLARTVKVTCANCKKPLKKGQTAYQRKGSTHLFCSTTCLSAFSHKPAPKKSCTMCKKDITNMKGTIVAQVDSSESFQEFCSTGCLSAYESKQNPPKSTGKTKCTVCGKLTEIRHEVSFKTVTHRICSDACFNMYRRANGLIMNCCEQCGDYLPSRASANHFLLVDGQQKRFCCHNCIRDFKQANSKLASCLTCKTLIKTGEVLHSIVANGTMGSYCSVTCMNKGKVSTLSLLNSEPHCHFCKRNALPQYQATLPEGAVLSFCSSQCVTKFQDTSLQSNTNGQTAPSADSTVQLKCNYCRGAFNLIPEVLEWEEKVYQFCSKTCCEDYKKLHCIVTFCEFCQEEKTLHETVKFSGVKRPFCSEGCKLLYKQDFIRRLGLKCVSCNHCSQMCRKGVTQTLGGMSRDFCSEVCAQKFHDWFYKAARCDCCRVQGTLTEAVMWRSEMKHFCDQQCLLRFYCQQNEPIMETQKGPENATVGTETEGAKLGLVSAGSVGLGGLLRDVKNKAVLCKPLTLTKATYCKPHMQSKPLQTDVDDGLKRELVPVPIPVPVFVPMPMNLYAQITPAPLTLPVPVPVPVILPTSLQGAEQILQTIQELTQKLHTLQAEAESKAESKPGSKVESKVESKAETEAESKAESMAETEAESKAESEAETEAETEAEPGQPDVKEEKTDVKKTEVKKEVTEVKKEKTEVKKETEVKEPVEVMTEKTFVKKEAAKSEEEWLCNSGSEQEEPYDPQLDLEEDFSPGTCSSSECPEPSEPTEEPTQAVSPPQPQPNTLGTKRRAMEGECARSRISLKSRYGLNAWRRWALSSTNQSLHTKDSSTPVCGSRDSLLELSSEQLNQALCCFVREVRRPNGERYSADSLLYLCLGLQKHLLSRGRAEDLFADSCFQPFVEELSLVLRGWKPHVLPDGSCWGRVQEDALWSSGHLGAHSPACLLRSLLYLNSKYLGARSVEQHLSLSFCHVYRTEPRASRSPSPPVPSLSQDTPEQSQSRKRKRQDDELSESLLSRVSERERPLYQLYRDKCPAAVRSSRDVLYLLPDPQASAEGLWFSQSPLPPSALEQHLTRALLVCELHQEERVPAEHGSQPANGEE